MNWHDYFDYSDGRLTHKARTPNSFKHPSTYLSWNKKFAGKLADTTKQGSGYRLCASPAGQKLVHRVVWELHNGTIPEGMQVDHINGVLDDNRIENLRLATHAENCRNAKCRTDSVSGNKGVYAIRGRNNLWRARICVNHRQVTVGIFRTREEAVEARKEATLRLHGEYAKP